MKSPTIEVNSLESQPALDAVSPSEVRRSLSIILQSPPFRSTPQIQKVLNFLVLQTLAGHGDSLKERVIGTSVFERPADYDTGADPIVRLRVAEVRKRLALYYQGAHEDTVLISIPTGSFKAVFESGKSPVPVPAGSRRSTDAITPSHESFHAQGDEAALADVQTRKTFRFGRWWIFGSAALLAAAAVAALHSFPSAEERAFNRFWSPLVENSSTVLVGMGNNPLYELSNAGEDEYYKNHPKDRFEEMGLHPYIPLTPGAPIDSKFINPATNTYLTIGDAVALSSIESVLVQRNRKLDIRFVNDLSYGDLRQNPTILIGVHNNIWTLNMTESLRFRFQGHSTIIDQFNPQTKWIANSDRSETYGVVARLLNSWNGKVVFIIGGIGYSG